MNALGLEKTMGIEISVVAIGVMTFNPLSRKEQDALGVTTLDRFLGEFHISRDEWEPLALAEIDRLVEVGAAINAGYLPDRWARDDSFAEVKLYPETNNSWRCDYCQFRTVCERDGDDAVHSKDSVMIRRKVA